MNRVHNFYGMVEQVGSVYVECEAGYLHAPNFADVLVRDVRDWSLLPPGREGVIEIAQRSAAKLSGPLALDRGSGRGPRLSTTAAADAWARYFTVSGRIPSAELRGCSDTYAETQGGP